MGDLIILSEHRERAEALKAKERAKHADEVASLEQKLKDSLFTEYIDLDRDSLFRLYSLAPESPVAMVGYALYAMSGNDGTGRPDYHSALSLLKRAARDRGFRKEALLLLLDSAPDFMDAREMTKYDVGLVIEEIFSDFFDDETVVERLYVAALDTMEDVLTAEMFCERGMQLNPARFHPYKTELDMVIRGAPSGKRD